MDEGILNDLLECSVCLERLDTSSKVLPCQHTFCKKCLEGIVRKHKELRCPECRIVVTSRIEDLPPNVLLMRILEGMRNATPKKDQQPAKSSKNNLKSSEQYITSSHYNALKASEYQHLSNKSLMQPQVHQPYAKALYDYSSKEAGDLNFRKGDIIVVKKRVDKNWFQGECNGHTGVFPVNFVQIITPLPSNTPQCKALYDFHMANDEEEGCLTFNKGDVITVIRRVDENWAEGRLYDKIGIFPLSFVELNGLARSLMKLSANAQPGPSRVAPPTPTPENSAQLIPTDHSRTVENVNIVSYQQSYTAVNQPQALPNSNSTSNSSNATPNVSSNNTSLSSSPSSPASPSLRKQSITSQTTGVILAPDPLNCNSDSVPAIAISSQQQQQQQCEKRHSFTSVNSHHHQLSHSKHRHSAEILSSEAQRTQPPQQIILPVTEQKNKKSSGDPNSIQLPATYIALYPYKPQKVDELELKKGGLYIVTERCQDGWFKGTSNRTQKCGVFPGNYVALAKGTVRSPQLASSKLNGGSKNPVNYVTYEKASLSCQQSSNGTPPQLPPRSVSPVTSSHSVSSSWQGQQENASVMSHSAIMSCQHPSSGNAVGKAVDKPKDRQEKVSLMRRLTSIKRSKSPPPSSYFMDNPVFEDSPTSVTSAHPIHIRSGSCPSQLLQILPADHHRKFSSQRLKHKERPNVSLHSSRSEDVDPAPSISSTHHHHRKSNSLDGSNKSKTASQNVQERYRCIAPYPPNSEYELELQVNDIIYVHKKRDDGWYKGTQQRTGRTGLFPASFVESF